MFSRTLSRRSRDRCAPERLPCSIDRDDGALVLEFFGELDVATSIAFERRLRRALGSSAPVVIVDLSGLDFIDCSGIRALVRVAEDSPGDRLAVLRGPEAVDRVFRLTRTAHRLPFAD